MGEAHAGKVLVDAQRGKAVMAGEAVGVSEVGLDSAVEAPQLESMTEPCLI